MEFCFGSCFDMLFYFILLFWSFMMRVFFFGDYLFCFFVGDLEVWGGMLCLLFLLGGCDVEVGIEVVVGWEYLGIVDVLKFLNLVLLMKLNCEDIVMGVIVKEVRGGGLFGDVVVGENVVVEVGWVCWVGDVVDLFELEFLINDVIFMVMVFCWFLFIGVVSL